MKKATTGEKYKDKELRRVNRELRWVRIGSMKVSSLCQRELRLAWVNELAANLDFEKIGNMEVSFRDGYYYIMDGQHRVEAVKQFLDTGWDDSMLQCWVAEGYTEAQEAEQFLSLNHRKSVNTFQAFKVAIRAGRPTETHINKIVNEESLVISQAGVPGGISCVGTLLKAYSRSGPEALGRALRLGRDAFGDRGLEAVIVDGFTLLCHRYNGVLDEQSSTAALSKIHGGVNGLTGAAEQLRQSTGSSKAQCVAAAAVTVINRGRTGHKKLNPWFKDNNDDSPALAVQGRAQ